MNSLRPANNVIVNPPQPTRPVILLVEDEAMVREVTRAVLQQAGYSVLESSTPDEALKLAKEHAGSIQLLLSDIVMPGMNGIELAQRLTDSHPALITMFMSGYPGCNVSYKRLRNNTTYIQKPFTMDALLSGVATALRAESARNADES